MSSHNDKGMIMVAKMSLLTAAAPLCALLLSPMEANAATEPAPAASDEVQEIVVTAQRRQERSQDVPIVISAFSGGQLESAGIKSTIDLAVVTPGLEFGTQAAYGQPFLRGVGTVANGPGVESPVALYVDGIYYGAMIGSVLTLNDIEQVEILKGPQGTLFGRNATGGLIQITTKDPTQQFGGYVSVGYGSYNTAGGDLYVNGGVTQTLAADLSVHYQDQGTGFGTNAFTGSQVNKTKDLSARSKWVLTADDDTSIKLIFDYSHQNFAQAYVPAPGTTPPGDVPYTGDPQGMNGIFDPLGRLNQGGASLQIRHDFGPAEFVSLTAYRQSAVYESFDGGLTRDPNSVLNLIIDETHSQFSQEFQLNSSKNWLKWSTGLYLFHADGKSDPLTITTLGLFGPPPSGLNNIYVYSEQKTNSAAAYGQATGEIAPATNLTAGLRYTYEHRTFDISEGLADFTGAAIPGPSEETAAQSFNKITYRLSVDHRFSPEIMTYASYNRGFKSGGFNDYLIAPTLAYAPETLDAFEIGAKTDLFERRAQLNVSVFDYEYKNIQAVEYPQGTEIIFNAAKARLYGLDLDGKAQLSEGLSATLGFEYLHDRFTDFPDASIATPLAGGGTGFTQGDVRGNRLGFAPDFTASFGLDYKIPQSVMPASWGGLAADVVYSFNDGWYAEPENRLRQPAYNVVNASVTWTSPDSLNKVTLWGNNLSNSEYTVALASQDTGDFAIYAPPRTYGIKYQRSF